MGLKDWLQHSFNLLSDRERKPVTEFQDYGNASYIRPDRVRLKYGNDRSIVNAIYTRIALDVSAIQIQHVRLDENGRFKELIDSSIQECLTVEANTDQTGRQLIQDIVMSMFDEGCIAVVPTETNIDPEKGSFDILKLRVGKIVQWYPNAVQVDLYDERDALHKTVTIAKSACAIIENPFYSVMNEPNSTFRRLVGKLAVLDAIDKNIANGKLNMIIQLPYTLRTDQKRQQAEQRRKDLEMQLTSSKYGVGYVDATERIVQLNQPLESNVFEQVQYLRNEFFNQFGMTEEVYKGTADEQAMLNYNNRTIEPILAAIVGEFNRKFLTKTARSQHQAFMYFRDSFKLVPVSSIADIADRFTRNEILSPNEIRAIIGYKPDRNPESDELRNRNLNKSESGRDDEQETPQNAEVPAGSEESRAPSES